MREKEKKLTVIVCPKCGREYLPAEIYIPKAFFGRPMDVSRDKTGKISYFDGSTLNLEETYICDNCYTPFKVHGRLSFTTEIDVDKDFDTDFCTSMYDVKRIKLKEE